MVNIEKHRYRKDVKYFIEMVGMRSDCMGYVTLDDGKYALIQCHPTYCIAIAPVVNANHPTFKEGVFYTNCLSYEHDLPAFICPAKKRKALVQPVEQGKNKYINDSFFQNLGIAYEALNSIRLGSLGYVCFKWPGFDKKVDIPYTKRYSGVKKEVSLYSTAVRQIDPLSEFLGYYRIIESISGNNGKQWISKNLYKLNDYNFGFLEFGSAIQAGEKRRRINVFTTYRRRALKRIKELKLSGKGIVKHLYNVNRCGIAHGYGDIKYYDFGYNVKEISKDVYILKLLSRIAIENKISI